VPAPDSTPSAPALSSPPFSAPPTTIHGTRVVAPAATLDAVVWPSSATVLRFAPDDAFVIGGDSVSISGEHAIVAAESGFVGCWLSAEELARVVGHIEWSLPTERPALAQGLIASVPAKLYLTGNAGADQQALLLTNAPYSGDLWERLS